MKTELEKLIDAWIERGRPAFVGRIKDGLTAYDLWNIDGKIKAIEIMGRVALVVLSIGCWNGPQGWKCSEIDTATIDTLTEWPKSPAPTCSGVDCIQEGK